MPQLGLFGEIMPAIRIATEMVICAGGCQRELPVSNLFLSPEGFMCDRCFDDLYTACRECGRLLRFDDWGECDNVTRGPDDVDRCIECDLRIFSRCSGCGRRTRRENEAVYTHPEESDVEYCYTCWASNWFVCSDCEEIYRRREAYFAPNCGSEASFDSTVLFCELCFSQVYFRCPVCGDSFSRENMHNWEGDPCCERCIGNADTWKVRPWSGKATSFECIGSKRCFGVELETESCDNYRILHGKTDWGCVYECSTPGREFISPILQGDEGLEEIRVMCKIAEQKRWTVDRSCGLHTHIDARDLTSDECLRVAYAYRKTYPMWKKFVSRGRSDNSMCGSPQYTCDDIRAAEHINDFVEPRDRFEFLNWRSYLCHESIEIRIYRGTLVAKEICNWVILHLHFVDAVKNMTFDELDKCFGSITRNNWKGLVKIINYPRLLDYWRKRANSYGTELAVLWDNNDNNDNNNDDNDSSWETIDYNEETDYNEEIDGNPVEENNNDCLTPPLRWQGYGSDLYPRRGELRTRTYYDRPAQDHA
jgi:hypothetical protein